LPALFAIAGLARNNKFPTGIDYYYYFIIIIVIIPSLAAIIFPLLRTLAHTLALSPTRQTVSGSSGEGEICIAAAIEQCRNAKAARMESIF